MLTIHIHQTLFGYMQTKSKEFKCIRKNGKADIHDYIQTFTGYSTNLLEIKGVTVRAGRLHPTQKPVELLEYLIRNYSNEGETVLDSCMGSGSTDITCINTNRNFIDIEFDKGSFENCKGQN